MKVNNIDGVAVSLSSPLETKLSVNAEGLVTLSVVVGVTASDASATRSKSCNSIAVQTTPEVAAVSLWNARSPSPQIAHVDKRRSARISDYQSIGEAKTGYSSLLNTDDEVIDPEAAEQLSQEIISLEAQVHALREHLADLDDIWTNRRKPHESELVSLTKQISQKHEQLEEARMPRVPPLPPPVGPGWLQFVTSNWFECVCNVVIMMNTVSMALQLQLKSQSDLFVLLDNMFLSWYVFELVAKVTYLQKTFFIGDLSTVWWAWLDLCIVSAGVLDQWLVPIIAPVDDDEHVGMYMSVLRALRLLRLFRILRFLKIIRVFLRSDLSWANGAQFELFMGAVIAVNSVVMALELDVHWNGWGVLENLLLVIYCFELAVRLKRDGMHFFFHPTDMVWHHLDSITAVSGVLDLWLAPLIDLTMAAMSGQPHQHQHPHPHGSMARLARLLKIMRILRVLRLVRLVKTIKPLYCLLCGILESVGSMQWVIVLTFLTLYACAIVFTDIVGRGILTRGHVTDAATESFGSVTRSLFSLFNLMNGDLTKVQVMTDSVVGQLMFVGFIVVSNWAILAILTSVVADNMILASRRHIQDLHEKKHQEERENRARRLRILFEEIDQDGDGRINNQEWQAMMEDQQIREELCDATGFDEGELHDYFECLAEYSNRPPITRKYNIIERNLDFNLFVEMLKDEARVADKRCIWHVMSEIRALQSSTEVKYRRSLITI